MNRWQTNRAGLEQAMKALYGSEPYTDEQRAADLSLLAAKKHRDHNPEPDLLDGSEEPGREAA